MGLFDIFFRKRNEELKAILSQGAVIIDVRTAPEFRSGKVACSINIPYEQINHKLGKIKKYKKPIVLCCASGSRSVGAMSMLRNAGMQNVYNGRTWYKVDRLLGELA